MKTIAKKVLRKSLVTVKKLANRNKYTKKAAQKAKRLAVMAIGVGEQRELYNLTSFFPTIQDYYSQTKDFNIETDPLISILLPTYNTPEEYLRECMESIVIQSYPKWELCIADDASSNKNVIEIIHEYQKKDDRIKLIVRKSNGHISEATNTALQIANGKFVTLMDHDDVLWPNALYEMVKVIRDNKKVDFIYSDEDKIDGSGKVHSYPFLKPDFSPEFLESCNYITHFSCIRTEIMKDIGGFRKGYEGAQDWDLFMRITEKTSNIVHIPKLLYSWRIHEASTASDTDAKPYVYEAQKKLLVDHIERIGMKGSVETGIITQHRTIKYSFDGNKLLSVFVFYKNFDRVKRVLQSLIENQAGAPFEIFYLHSATVPESEKTELYQIEPKLIQKFVPTSKGDEYETAIRIAKGDYLFFISDAAEVVSDNWAKTLIGDGQLSGVGLIGPVLLDPTKQIILSAGIGIGYGPDGYMDMLQGMPFNDPHYSRGLYAKSRRNISAVNGTSYGLKKSILAALINKPNSPRNAIELSLALIAEGLRHIYTPYIQIVVHGNLDRAILAPGITDAEDRYLNPNFNHDNQRMEVKA